MEITRFSFFFFLASKRKICDSMGYWGMIVQWHWIGLQFFWTNWRLEMKNFWFSYEIFILYVSRFRVCIVIVRFCGNCRIVVSRIENVPMQDIFLSWRYFVEFPNKLSLSFLIYFFPKVVYRPELKHKGLVKESSSPSHPRFVEQVETVVYDRARWENPMIGQK